MRKSLVALGVSALLAGAASPVSASTITYVTAPGATTSGGAVDAAATFSTATNQLTITLQDFLANPSNVAQLPSDLFFTLSGGLTAGTLASSTATEIQVNADGTSTLLGAVATGWVLSSTGGTFHLDDLSGLGHAGPEHLILGPSGLGGLYTNANGSIANNSPHNPFLNQSALFILTIPGMTSATTVTSVTFSFGTTAGINVPGIPEQNVTPVPEPAGLLLFAIGLLAVARFVRKAGARA